MLAVAVVNYTGFVLQDLFVCVRREYNRRVKDVVEASWMDSGASS